MHTEGEWGWSGSYVGSNGALFSSEKVSVGLFQWVKGKSGKPRPGKAKIRLWAYNGNADDLMPAIKRVVELLNQGRLYPISLTLKRVKSMYMPRFLKILAYCWKEELGISMKLFEKDAVEKDIYGVYRESF